MKIKRGAKAIYVPLIALLLLVRLRYRQLDRQSAIQKMSSAIVTAPNLTIPENAKCSGADLENDVATLTSKLDRFRVDLIYRKFTTKPPRFIDELDRKWFNDNPDNRRFMRLPSRRELLGKVRLLRDAVIRVGHHECSWMSSDDEFDAPSTGHFSVTQLGNITSTPTTLVPLLVPDGHTFQHFVDGVLPKLVQLFVADIISDCSRFNNLVFVIYRPRDVIIYDMLSQLGVTRDQLRLVEPSSLDSVIEAPRLMNTCVTPGSHPVLWRIARQLLLRTTTRSRATFEKSHFQFADGLYPTDSKTSPANYVILLLRHWTRNRGRHLLNEQAVFDLLVQRYGPSRVFRYGAGRRSLPVNFVSARRLFSDASLIIGVHGGAFYNIMMAPENCTIVEVMPLVAAATSHARYADGGSLLPGLAHTIVWRIASALRQTYWRLYAVTSSVRGDVTIPVNTLNLLLDRIQGR